MFAEQIAWAPAVWFAMLSCLGTLVLYLTLVPLHKNNGAKRLAFVLGIGTVLLALTLARIYRGDWNGRYEFITAGFILIGFAFIYMAWTIWTDQYEGAKKYRLNKHPKSKE